MCSLSTTDHLAREGGGSEGAALDPGGSCGLPGSSRGHRVRVELQGERTPAHRGWSPRALPRGRHPGLARTPVRWTRPVDDFRLARGEDSAVPVRYTRPVDEHWLAGGEDSAGPLVNELSEA